MSDLISVLCCSRKSIYKSFDGVEVYDIDRDVRTFDGKTRIVAHPPCRTWSAFTAHQAKAPEGEKDLGPLCVEFLKQCGGVLEHPAHSRLFKHMGLPMPGKSSGDYKTVAVWQSWFGYSMRKSTWLTFVGIDPNTLDFPYILTSPGGDRRKQQLMSKDQRAETCPAFGRWLVDAARQAPEPGLKRYSLASLDVGNSRLAF